jgi:endonuclease-3 related protein
MIRIVMNPEKKPPPLRAVFDALHAAWGDQHWWPAESAWEMMVGAVLTQNTAWVNVERAISRLKEAHVMDLHRMYSAGVVSLETWIRPSGTFRVKARRLFALMEMIMTDYQGDLERFLGLPAGPMREKLLAVPGIGPETADCMVLYAGGHPRFVIDTYTRRILSRHGWITGAESYGEVATMFQSELEPDAAGYAEYHALLVRLGKKHCRAQPTCASCPLNSFLPPEGPRK